MPSLPLKVPGPAYRVITERLVLRCYQPSDAALVKAAVDANLSHLSEMPWIRGEPQSLDEKIAVLRKFRGQFDLGQDFTYGIFDSAERSLLGSCGLHTRVGDGAREIGYWIHVAHVGRGLATEAAAALTRVGFEIDRLERIEIHCAPTNLSSAQVARKLGYTHEATLRGRNRDVQDRPRDTMVFSLFAADYPATPSAAAQLSAFDAASRQIL